MAGTSITITSPTLGVASTSNVASYALAAFTPTANNLLIVFATVSGNTAAGTVTGGGLTWVPITNVVFATGANIICAYYAKVGASPALTTVTYTTSGSNGSGAVLTILQAAGYDSLTNNPIKQNTVTSSGGISNANVSITFTSPIITTNAICATLGGGLTAGSITQPTGFTETDDIAYITPSTTGETCYATSGNTATTYAFTHATTFVGAIGLEIYLTGTGPSSSSSHITTLGLLGVG